MSLSIFNANLTYAEVDVDNFSDKLKLTFSFKP